MHLGHSCFPRSPVTISTYCRRVTVPYRALKPPASPIFFPISPSPRPISLLCSRQPSALPSALSSSVRLGCSLIDLLFASRRCFRSSQSWLSALRSLLAPPLGQGLRRLFCRPWRR